MSKGPTVNIPRDVEDPFYRYKMPVLKAKVEGKGNGIKTVIENMVDIAKAMDRPAEYVIRFFGFELGLLTKWEGSKYVVHGKFDSEDLSVVLDKFIEKYVLCKQCRNPETDLSVKGEIINSKCRACGKLSQVDMSHKLSTFILKNAPPSQIKQPQTAPTKKTRDNVKEVKTSQTGDKKVTPQPIEEEVQWSTDTSQAAVEARRRELLGARDRLSQKEEKGEEKQGQSLTLPSGTNPIPILSKYFESGPDPDDCVNELKNLSTKQQWSDTTLIKYIFASLFPGDDMTTNFYKKTDILALFCTSEKHKKIVLYCIEKKMEETKKLMEQLPSLLNGFFEECIIDEKTLIKWYSNPNKKADFKFSKEVREKSKIFIDWLKNAEVEENV